MSHQSTTFTDAVAAAAATTTPVTVFPPKPSNWSIFPGKMFLAASAAPGPDSASAGNRVMTQIEVSLCELWAWEDVLVALAGKFDVCDWGEDPPFGLERDWNMLASALYLQMANSGMTVEGRVSPVWMAWMDVVRMQMDRINSGVRVLMNSTCSVIRPDPVRAGVLKIGIAGRTIPMFAGNDDEAMDDTFVGGSLQEIQRLHGRQSVTYGGRWPVAV
jgi:hypothetical protein